MFTFSSFPNWYLKSSDSILGKILISEGKIRNESKFITTCNKNRKKRKKTKKQKIKKW